ncbi:hypothetical protein [Plantactinospora sp. WMMB782]
MARSVEVLERGIGARRDGIRRPARVPVRDPGRADRLRAEKLLPVAAGSV